MNIDEYIRFDDINKQFTIPSGTYSYSDVVRVSALNEKAKYKGKGIPKKCLFKLVQDFQQAG